MKDHLHQLFAGQFRPRKVAEHLLAMFGIQTLALCNPVLVCVLEFNPPIRLKLLESYQNIVSVHALTMPHGARERERERDREHIHMV